MVTIKCSQRGCDAQQTVEEPTWGERHAVLENRGWFCIFGTWHCRDCKARVRVALPREHPSLAV